MDVTTVSHSTPLMASAMTSMNVPRELISATRTPNARIYLWERIRVPAIQLKDMLEMVT
jgi:hypothetical protein